MPCDHLGPDDLIAMTEEALRKRALEPAQWAGIRARHGENLTGSMWASVVIEIERRGDRWFVTRLDRNSASIPQSEAGLKILDPLQIPAVTPHP
jgi:hypothetical protein